LKISTFPRAASIRKVETLTVPRNTISHASCSVIGSSSPMVILAGLDVKGASMKGAAA
jgi:hypothetical protein